VERFNAAMDYLRFSVVVVLAIHLDPRDEEIEILQQFGAIRLPMPAEWTTALNEQFRSWLPDGGHPDAPIVVVARP
jgi:hypothetical protein